MSIDAMLKNGGKFSNKCSSQTQSDKMATHLDINYEILLPLLLTNGKAKIYILDKIVFVKKQTFKIKIFQINKNPGLHKLWAHCISCIVFVNTYYVSEKMS